MGKVLYSRGSFLTFRGYLIARMERFLPAATKTGWEAYSGVIKSHLLIVGAFDPGGDERTGRGAGGMASRSRAFWCKRIGQHEN